MKQELDYVNMADRADKLTEQALSRMSQGTLGVFKDKMYPIVFKSIYDDLIINGEVQ